MFPSLPPFFKQWSFDLLIISGAAAMAKSRSIHRTAWRGRGAHERAMREPQCSATRRWRDLPHLAVPSLMTWPGDPLPACQTHHYGNWIRHIATNPVGRQLVGDRISSHGVEATHTVSSSTTTNVLLAPFSWLFIARCLSQSSKLCSPHSKSLNRAGRQE